MSNDYGNGGYPANPDPNQGQGYPPQNYQPQPQYPPQAYAPQGSYPPPPPQAYPPPPPPQYATPDEFARYPQQGYGAPPTPPVAPVRKGRGPLPFIVAIVVIAALAVGGYFLWQNVGKPLIAGVAYDKLLPNTTMAYVSYNATPGQDQQANWTKIHDAFTSQPGVQDKLNQLGAQAGLAPMMLSNFVGQCSQTANSASSGGSIISNIGGFLSGNVTLAYLQPSDAEVQKVVKDAISSGGMMGDATMNTMTLGGPATTKPGSSLPPAPSNNGANSQQATCEAFNLVEDHLVAVVELDVNPLDPNSIIARLQQKTNDQNKGSLTKDETYNGSDIYKINLDTTTGSASTFYGVLIGKEGILSSNKDSLKSVIDAYKDGSKSLSSNAQYTTALTKLPTERSMTLYMDSAKFAGTVSAALTEAAKDSPSMSSLNSSKSIYDQMKNSNSVSVVGVTARTNGVQIDSAGNVSDSAAALTSAMPLISDRSIVKLMPADTWAFVASANLKDLINNGLTYLDKMNYFSSMNMGSMNTTQLKQQFKQATGLDLDSDVLSWMGGEWGMYIQPGADASTPAQGGFVLNVKDSKAQATAGIQKINTAIKNKLASPTDQYAPTVTEQQVAGSKIFKFGSMGSAVYYGIVGDYFFITSNTATMQAIASGKGGVTDSANYKGAMTNAITNNSAVMYVNIQAIREAVEKMASNMGASLSASYDKDIKPFLVPFRSMGITEDNANGLQHSVLFVDIEK